MVKAIVHKPQCIPPPQTCAGLDSLPVAQRSHKLRHFSSLTHVHSTTAWKCRYFGRFSTIDTYKIPCWTPSSKRTAIHPVFRDNSCLFSASLGYKCLFILSHCYYCRFLCFSFSIYYTRNYQSLTLYYLVQITHPHDARYEFITPEATMTQSVKWLRNRLDARRIVVRFLARTRDFSLIQTGAGGPN